MKSRILWSWGLGLVVATLLLAGGSPQEASRQATNALSGPREANTEAAALATANEETLGAQTEAAVKPISTGKPLPRNIKPAGPVSEVIKLADSGVDESVMMAFVTSSTRPFNLGVEEIIYLNDIGVSGSVVIAMMQRDQALKELSVNPAAVSAAPASVASANQFAPEPGTPASYAPQPAAALAPPEVALEGAPQGDYAADNYPPPPAADTGYSTSYDSSAPYGTWVDVEGYGPCWQPTVVVVNSTTVIGSARTMSTVRRNPAPRSAAPLILRGPDRPGGVKEVFPPNALVVIGSKEGNPQQTAHPSWAWMTERPRSSPTAFSHDAFSRPAADQKEQPVTVAAWATPARSEPAWSAARPAERPTRSEQPRQHAAPGRNGR